MKAKPSCATYTIYSCFIICLITLLSVQTYIEWLQVNATLELAPLEYFTPVSCIPDPAHEGQVVHIDCAVQKNYKFYPAKDFSWNLSRVDGLFFDTKVEMFQWAVRPGSFGATVQGSWSKNQEVAGVPSLLGLRTKSNPSFWPSVPGQGRQFPPALQAGSFNLDPQVIGDFHGNTRVPLTQDGYFKMSAKRPPSKVDYYNTQVFDHYLYTGDPLVPQIGDMRISFYTSKATHVSAIGIQECNRFGCSLVPVPREPQYIKEDNPSTLKLISDFFDYPMLGDLYENSILLVAEGDHTGKELLRNAIADRSVDAAVIWSIRVLTFLTAVVVGVWSIGLAHPNKKIGVTRNRVSQIFTVIGGGVGCGMFISFALITGPLWMLCNSILGVSLIMLGLLGLGLVFTVGAQMTELGIEGGRRKDTASRTNQGYQKLELITEYDDDVDARYSSKERGDQALSNSESSFYQAI